MSETRFSGQHYTRYLLATCVTALIVLLASACGGGGGDQGSGGDGGGPSGKMVIAIQPGLGYAPLITINEKGWLEKDLPNMDISFQQLSSGSAIRDGMISGDIQVGAGGIGPLLIGWDRGVDWKVLSPMLDAELWLNVDNEKFQSLEDFEPGADKIAMPAPDSIQSVILRKGAQEQLGDARALDTSIVSLAHPDGLQQLLSGQIQGHLTSPPFEFQEVDEGARTILRSYDVFGQHTFNSVWVRQSYYEENQEAMQVLYDNLERAIELINDNPGEVAQILSEASDGANSPEEYEGWLTKDVVNYTNEPQGFVNYAEFIKEIEMIEGVPECSDIMHESLGDLQEC
ncbi:ABC transporter substrate-binding protein [soil metagenome]